MAKTKIDTDDVVNPFLEAKAAEIDARFPDKFKPFLKPMKYKIAYGGRSGGKTWACARALLLLGMKHRLRILCIREIMASIKDSSHQVLKEQIEALGIEEFYTVEESVIRCKNHPNPNKCTEFIFKGIKRDVYQLKSTEGIDITWVDEADNVSMNSWNVLEPTVMRKSIKQGGVMNSELWITFNPKLATDATWRKWVLNPPPGESVVVKMNYTDLPPNWVPEGIRSSIEHMKATDPVMYRHVYEGENRAHLEGAVYENEVRQAEAEGWFREDDHANPVKYQSGIPVEAFFDLGDRDATALWVAQQVGGLFHIIDYVEGFRSDIANFYRILSNQPYAPVYKFHLPHDARQHHGGNASIEEQLRKLTGPNGQAISIVSNTSLVAGINATRAAFPLMRFNLKKCEQGINHLRSYHYDTQPTMIDGVWRLSEKPVHDESSHAADALRYLAIALKPPKEVKPLKINIPPRHHFGGNGWMT